MNNAVRCVAFMACAVPYLLGACSEDAGAVLGLAACAAMNAFQGEGDLDLAGSVHEWEARLAALEPLGRDVQAVAEELEQLLDLEGEVYPSGEGFGVVLERLPGDGCVCSHWMVTGSFAAGADGRVEQYAVSHAGVCL